MSEIIYRVQTVPGREECLERLLPLLPPAVEIIRDDGPPPSNPYRGYLRCLSGLPDCSHVLVLQDDALPCRNLARAIERIAAAQPDRVVSLFVGALRDKTHKDMLQAGGAGRRYAPVYFRGIHHVVALLWPRQRAEAFLAWIEATPRIPGLPRENRSDDAVVGAWARLSGNHFLATVPSLVEHDGSVPSTIGRPYGRKAALFIGESDPLELDW